MRKQASSDEKELRNIFRLLQRQFGSANRWGQSGFEDQYVSIEKGTSLLFVSNSKSDHIENLKHNEKCAVTIQENNLDWENIKGVQLKGTIELASEKYWDEYLGKFQYISESETLTKAMKKVNLYKLKITWARFIDNSKGFGNKKEYNYS